MINWSELVYGHFRPQTLQSLTLTFTRNLTLLTLLTSLQPPASILGY